MSCKRILLSINVRWWNAEAAYAINLARGLVEQNIDVWLIVNPQSPVHRKAEEYGLQTISDVLLDSRSVIVQLGNLKKIIGYIDKLGIELINSFKSNGSILFSIAKRFRPGITYIKTRGIASPPKNNFVNRYLYDQRSCDGIITVGSTVKGWINDLLGENSKQAVKTIFYGDSHFPAVDSGEDNKPETIFNPPEHQKVCVLLGRTQQVKGHLLLLRALKDLQHLNLHILFLVKDLDEFPEVLNEIKHFISQHHLENRVTILGYLERLDQVLAHVHCGVIPSLASEVNCRVCVEFFSLGIPVIAFPTGTLPDIVSHLENGYLCKNKSVEELIKGLTWTLEDEVGFEQSKLNALADYNKKFTLQKMACDTLQFYQECKNV